MLGVSLFSLPRWAALKWLKPIWKGTCVDPQKPVVEQFISDSANAFMYFWGRCFSEVQPSQNTTCLYRKMVIQGAMPSTSMMISASVGGLLEW